MKRCRRQRVEEDRISNLSDDILCTILSLLPDTKSAVRTSVLSRRFINLWTRLPVLQFDCDLYDLKEKNNVKPFVRFVDNVISRNTSPNIQKFRLHYHKPKRFTVFKKQVLLRNNDWVQTALSRNVVELDLQIYNECQVNKCNYKKASISLLNYFLPQVLKIKMDVPLRMPSFSYFGNLKTFHIELDQADYELTSKLFTSLPKLEELSISICMAVKYSPHYYKDFNIIAPVLKVLDFHVWDRFDRTMWMKVLIDAPMLERITLTDETIYSYTLQNISSNLQANINVGIKCDGNWYDDHDRGIKLIDGLSSAKSLSISENTMRASSIQSAENLPVFHYLTNLELFVDGSLWDQFLHFVINAPNLEVLTLAMVNVKGKQFKKLRACALLHLKEVEVYGLPRIKAFKLLKYISESAVFLEKFTADSVVLVI